MNELAGMQVWFFVINLILVFFIAVVVGITPMITRKSLLFGVRIPESAGDSPEAKKLKRHFVGIVIAGTVVTLILLVVQYLVWPELTLLAMMYFPLILLAVQTVAFIPSWKKAALLKKQKGWAAPFSASVETRTAAEREKLFGFPKGWYWLSLLAVFITVVISLVLYPSLPETIVTHWNASMKPDQWSDKSVLVVLLMPLISVLLILTMLVSNIGVFRMKLQVSAENPLLSYAQHRMYRRMMSRALGFVTFGITLFMCVFQCMTLNIFMIDDTLMMVCTVILILISCLPFLYVTIKSGQSGCRLKPSVSEQESARYAAAAGQVRAVHPGRGDDQYWKLGMFYYNPDDPAILVEDRFGQNGGFNYARGVSKIMTGLLILTIVVTYAVTTVLLVAYM